MIITQKEPFTARQITQLHEAFPDFIKTVFDLETKICSAGAERHVDSEQVLLKEGSKQSNLWGGGVDTETKEITIDSMINIRPADNNKGNQIQDPLVREKFEALTRFFFPTILND